MRSALVSVVALAVAACVPAQDDFKPYFWKLVSINGQPFAASASLAFDKGSTRAFGQAPCNGWSGQVVKEPFPEYAIRDVTATEMACEDLAAEQAFFAGVARATHTAVGIGYLTLTDTKGFTMEFAPVAP